MRAISGRTFIKQGTQGVNKRTLTRSSFRILLELKQAKLETVKYSNNDNMDRLSLFKEDENDDEEGDIDDVDNAIDKLVKVLHLQHDPC